MRPVCIVAAIALMLLAVLGFGHVASAQTTSPPPAPPPSTVRPLVTPSESLLCALSATQPMRLHCNQTGLGLQRQPSLAERVRKQVDSKSVLVSSSSLWVANNLATKDSTTKFLRGVTGSDSLARKIAPTAMRISKSLPARAGLAVAVLASGGIALYEGLFGDDPAPAASAPGGKPVEMRFIGVIDPSGQFRATPLTARDLAKPEKKP
jgi:hypothetical protein